MPEGLSRRDSRTQPRVSTLGTSPIIPNRPEKGGRFGNRPKHNIISTNATFGISSLAPFEGIVLAVAVFRLHLDLARPIDKV